MKINRVEVFHGRLILLSYLRPQNIQRILDAMQRGVTVEQVRRAVELCRQRGIETGMFLMWGYEGEQLADIEETIKHVKACLPDVFLTTVSYPIKGTPYFDEISDRLVSMSPWPKSTDREFKIRGRHSRTYYSFADQLLKSEVALERLRKSDNGPASATGSAELETSILSARQGLETAATEVEA